MEKPSNDFFRITKFTVCMALVASLGLAPLSAHAFDGNSSAALTTAASTPVADQPSENVPSIPALTEEPADEPTPTREDDFSRASEEPQLSSLEEEYATRSVAESESYRVDDLPVNDSTDTQVYKAFTTANKEYYETPSTDGEPIGSWPSDTEIGFVHWDSSGKWLTALIGNKRIFFTSDDLEVIPTYDSQDRATYRFVALRNAYRYVQPDVRSRVLGYFPKGHSAQCRPLDAAGKWYFASVGDDLVYFRAADIEILPDRTSRDFSVYSAITNQITKYYAHPSVKAAELGSWRAGTEVGYVNYSDGWVTATRGSQRIYFEAKNLSSLPKNDSGDSSVYSAVTLSTKNYYSAPSTDSQVLGTWDPKTRLGYFRWDREGKWLRANKGSQTIFFTAEGLETFPNRTATDDRAHSLYSLAEVPYYDAPSTNAAKVGSFPTGTELGGVWWNETWMSAMMGHGRVYFKTSDLVFNLSAGSVSARYGLALSNASYFSRPDTSSEKKGEFSEGTFLGFVPLDLGGRWYSASMGPKGRVYFKADQIETLPEKTHRDQAAHSAYSTENVAYYEHPSTKSKKVGSFPRGTRLGYIHWDAGNNWYWARVASGIVYFQPDGLEKLPDRDERNTASYLSYALEDVPYYSDVRTGSSHLGTFKKGSMPGLVYYDAARTWATATTGHGRVYFQTKNLAIVPKRDTSDTRGRSGRTTTSVTYYEAPTTRSKALGAWNAGTNLGFYKWDSGNQWYWARRGSQTIYFPASSVKRMISPQEVIDIARSQVGATNGWKYLNAAYGPNYYVAWCAIFQWWVFYQAGAEDLFYGGGISPSPAEIMHYYERSGQIVGSPQVGDLVFMSTYGYASHIGIVSAVSDNSVRVTEGNYLDRVQERWLPKWGGRGGIVGYARPSYS